MHHTKLPNYLYYIILPSPWFTITACNLSLNARLTHGTTNPRSVTNSPQSPSPVVICLYSAATPVSTFSSLRYFGSGCLLLQCTSLTMSGLLASSASISFITISLSNIARFFSKSKSSRNSSSLSASPICPKQSSSFCRSLSPLVGVLIPPSENVLFLNPWSYPPPLGLALALLNLGLLLFTEFTI